MSSSLPMRQLLSWKTEDGHEIKTVQSDVPGVAKEATSDQESLQDGHQQAPLPMEDQQQGQEGSQIESQQETEEEEEPYKKPIGKNYKKNKMRQGRDRYAKRTNAVDTKMPPANTSTPVSKSASQNIDFQSSVDQLALHWQDLNKSVAQNPDELYNLGLASETLLYTAATEFKPLQLAVFKRKIRELGGEVEESSVHFQRACAFGEKVSDELLESGIDPAVCEKALENLNILAHLSEFSVEVLEKFKSGLEPRLRIYQARRVASLAHNKKSLKALLDHSAEVTVARLNSESNRPGGTGRSFRLVCRSGTPSTSTSDPESDDYEPEESSPINTNRGEYADRSYPEVGETVFSPGTESAESDDRFNTVPSTDDEERLDDHTPRDAAEDPNKSVQNNSLAAKLAREELLFHELCNLECPVRDTTVEHKTDQDTSAQDTIDNAIPADESAWEDASDQETTIEKTFTEETDTANEPLRDSIHQKKKPVRISLCLNPKSLKVQAQFQAKVQKTLDEETAVKHLSNLNPEDPDRISESFPLKMAITAEVSLPLPPLPADWSGSHGKDFKAIGNVSASTLRSVEPVGPYYLAHARRARHKRTFSEDDRIQAQESVKTIEDSDSGEISEAEDPAMLIRDAKDWKGQDHYAVLGLSSYRWRATEEQIKRAHRKKVLRHHPDKKAAAGNTEDDSFFKCIQKATEILLDPTKRRQFDSVDEAADVEPPTKKQTQKGNFYKLWGPVFKAEGRFSKIQPVPKLGDETSSREEVDNFYNFWYNFDSWRSFEYQDEDVPDDNENRDQKRHMERKNNNARKKKKTEDSARLRRLLDDCSALDERIKKFRQEANASKNKKRLEKEAAEKKAAEEAKVKKEAEEKAAKEADEAAKVEREQGKKAKEAAKNAVKKNKRVLKGSVKDANYFVVGNPPPATIDAVLNDVELIQGKVDADEIAALAGKLTGLKVSDEIKAVWKTEVLRLVEAGKLKDGDIKTIV